jgi:hypothetical protein
MSDTINWGIFKRHFWGELLRHQHWALCSTVADTSPNQINLAGARADKLVVVARRGDKLVILKPSLGASVSGPY